MAENYGKGVPGCLTAEEAHAAKKKGVSLKEAPIMKKAGQSTKGVKTGPVGG